MQPVQQPPMDGDELLDGRQGQDGIQDGPSTLVQCGGAALLVPATATPSCISKQKSIACDKNQGVSSGLNVLGDAAQRSVMEKIEKEVIKKYESSLEVMSSTIKEKDKTLWFLIRVSFACLTAASGLLGYLTAGLF